MSRRPHAKYLRSIFFFILTSLLQGESAHPRFARGKSQIEARGCRTACQAGTDRAESLRAATALPLARGGTSSRGPSRVRLPQRTVSHTRVSFRLALEGKNGRFPQSDSCSLDRCATKTLKCVVRPENNSGQESCVLLSSGHWPGGLNDRRCFLTALEAGSPRSTRAGGFLARRLSWAGRCCLPAVRTPGSPYMDTNPLGPRSHPDDPI